MVPDPWLDSDPACSDYRSSPTQRLLGSVRRPGAGGAGQFPSTGIYDPIKIPFGVHPGHGLPVLFKLRFPAQG
jgi:hypothetical protein